MNQALAKICRLSY